jgi:hypothetical protein
MHKLSYNDVILVGEVYHVYDDEFEDNIIFVYNYHNFPLKTNEEDFYMNDIIKPFTEIHL